MQTCKDTQDIGSLTRAADFVRAFVLGFQVEVSSSTFWERKALSCWGDEMRRIQSSNSTLLSLLYIDIVRITGHLPSFKSNMFKGIVRDCRNYCYVFLRTQSQINSWIPFVTAWSLRQFCEPLLTSISAMPGSLPEPLACSSLLA